MTEQQRGQESAAERRRRLIEKAIVFLAGWFTVPFLTGGVWYDLFGGLEAGEAWQRVTHPGELVNALGIYTIAFALFGFLPEKISKAGWGRRILYFLLFYLLLDSLAEWIF